MTREQARQWARGIVANHPTMNRIDMPKEWPASGEKAVANMLPTLEADITAALLAVQGEALEEAVQIANQHEAWRVRDAIRALAHSSGAKPS